MENLLKLKERLEIALELGESYYCEFKSALEGPPNHKIPRELKDIFADIAKTLVAFANADGGALFLGVEDNCTVSGVPFDEEKLNAILDSAENYVLKETPLEIKSKNIIRYNGQKVVYFSVYKGSKYVHQTSKGECFQRIDRESRPTGADQIRFAREEILSREYDRQFIDLARLTDLDLSLVLNVAQEITKIKNISPEKFLQYMELAEFDGENFRLRRAALLLFAKNPNKWHPRSRVRILKINGTEEQSAPSYNVTEVADIDGNIFHLIDHSWEALRPALTETRYSNDGLFKTQIIYPDLACKEALINAITHRDYSIEGRGIEIRIFLDRLEVLSPGKLLSKYSIEDLKELKGAHETRNTYIARVLREFGYIRELGEGIRRMYELMKSNELVEPQISSPNKSFIVTLFNKFIYTKEEKVWLDQFDHLKLTREQKTVVKLGINNRLVSPKEIFDNVGIVDTDDYRELIGSLQKLGILITKISKIQAQNQAKRIGRQTKSIPRYEIQLPKDKSVAVANTSPLVGDDKSDYSKVFVGNVDFSVSESELSDFMSRFGEISDVQIAIDKITGNPRGFAFVEFEQKSSLENALKNVNPLFLRNRKLQIRRYKN
jgi:ATP-dependent DNA helicase RecG